MKTTKKRAVLFHLDYKKSGKMLTELRKNGTTLKAQIEYFFEQGKPTKIFKECLKKYSDEGKP